MNTLKKNIMRRIYLIFALRLTLHPFTLHGFVIVTAFLYLSQLVSIPNVLMNMLEVKVGELINFWLQAILHTQIPAQILIGVIAITLLSLIWRLKNVRHQPMQMA